MQLYQGKVFELYFENGKQLWEEAPLNATLTPKEVLIDYADSFGEPIHVKAISSDGFAYSGRWGDPKLNPDYPVELQRFDNKNEVVLLGTWEDKKTFRQGVFV